MYTDYQSRTKKVIKWYEYHMSNPGETDPVEAAALADGNTCQKNGNVESSISNPEGIMSLNEANDVLTEMSKEEEDAVALAESGLSDSDQALVADIMARFKDAKQSSVDTVFATNSMESDESPQNEEDLVASICAPKQNNVDALVRQAKDQ